MLLDGQSEARSYTRSQITKVQALAAARAMVAAAHIEAFSHAADELESDWGSIS